MGVRASTLGDALIRECELANVHGVDHLLREGAAVNYHNKSGATPLTSATYNGYWVVFSRLLAHPEVDLEAEDTEGRTPLFNAARYGHEGMVQALLDRGVAVDMPKKDGGTPFMWAARQGHIRIVKLLVRQRGSEINVAAKDAAGYTALSGAAMNGHLIVVKYLLSLDGVRPNTLSTGDVTALLHAATVADVDMVHRLLKVDGLDADIGDRGGRNALIQATYKANTALMGELLGSGRLDVNAQNADGMTALMTAASHGFAGPCKMLVDDAGTQVNLRDANGVAALMHAVVHDFLAPVVLLLAKTDIDVNTCDWAGSTPLMQAMALSSRFILEELLLHPHIDINVQDSAGSLAFVYGCEHDRTPLVIDMLLPRPDFDPNALLHYWETPLHYAVRRDNAALAAALLRLPATNVNAVDRRGQGTALMWAVRRQALHFVNALKVAPGVARDATDSTAMTPLLRAAYQAYGVGVAALLDLPGDVMEVEAAAAKAGAAVAAAARKAQLEADRIAALPPEEESEGEGGDIDDSDEDVVWSLGDSQAPTTRRRQASEEASDAGQSTAESLETESLQFGEFKVKEDTVDGDGEEEEEEEEEEDLKGDSRPFYARVFRGDSNTGGRESDAMLARASVPCDVHHTVRGWSALNWAAHHGSVETTRVLLAAVRPPGEPLTRDDDPPELGSAWLHQRFTAAHHTDDGESSLMWAVKEDHLPVVDALLGVSCLHVATVDSKGATPLVVAVRQRQLHHVRHLLRCPHTDTDRPGPDGVTPLHMAIQQEPRNRDIITALLAVTRVNPEQHDTEHLSPLHVAIDDGDGLLFHELVACPRTDLNHAHPTSQTPLMRVAANGQQPFVDVLLGLPARADINAQDGAGWTPLMHAAHAGHYDVVLAMLRLVTVDLTKKTADDLDVIAVSMLRPHFAVRRLLRGRVASMRLMVAWIKRIKEAWAAEVEGSEVDYSDF